MFAVRGIVAAALVGAATLIGSGAATAAPLPLGEYTPVESVAKSCEGVIHPLAVMMCTLTSLSG
ncbi:MULTISPECIES: hypothetical protein [Nocardia]|uniref:hypothetical protein n=1 Tax=Nocardia TaxID=1817 RepID=UPI000D1DE23C|nr:MULTISPECIES: hypothetical protein [Nocardia]